MLVSVEIGRNRGVIFFIFFVIDPRVHAAWPGQGSPGVTSHLLPSVVDGVIERKLGYPESSSSQI